MRPPRALWVPFMLGRPFGAPNEPDFQRRVLRALLALFEHPSGPVLEDFPDDAPVSPAEGGEFAPPVSRARVEEGDRDLEDALQCEIARLRPWYDAARIRRGRTTVGISRMTIDQAAAYAASYLDLGPSPAPPYADGLSAGMALKRACDDVKAYYYEATAAQPGNLTAEAIDRWFWHETVAATLFLRLREISQRSPDASLRPLGEIALVPLSVVQALVPTS